jgi:hypothetical protein
MKAFLQRPWMMHTTFSVLARRVFSRVALLLFLSALAMTSAAQRSGGRQRQLGQNQSWSPAAPPAKAPDAQPTAADRQPPVSAKINSLAHRLLAAGLKANALAGDDLKPWHLKIDYQMQLEGNAKLVSGTVEEWHASQYRWRRTFTGPGGTGLNGTIWSVSEIERYETKAERDFIGRRLVTLRIARPVIDPLYQTANIHPEYDMDLVQANAGSLVLNCVSVINARQYAVDTNPDWLFPTMCFDTEAHLRATNAGNTSVQFDNLQPFQNRAVARDVKVIFNGNLDAEMKVSVLEAWDGADASLLKPAKNAVAVPYEIEPGHPLPESVFEVAAHLPLLPIKTENYDRVVMVSILIHKDGSVKAESAFPNFFAPGNALQDSVEMAVSHWKYKPYLVDGKPVEIASSVVYQLDKKPFVPSYERPKSGPVTTSPDDYSSAYDPGRNPAKDLEKAKAAAAQQHKRILVEVGGNWCIWCKLLDSFFAEQRDVRQLRDSNFVLLKVNMSPFNENIAFLNQYPKIPGYPYLFVLDADGKLIVAKDTGALEQGSGYSAKSLTDFLNSVKGQ